MRNGKKRRESLFRYGCVTTISINKLTTPWSARCVLTTLDDALPKSQTLKIHLKLNSFNIKMTGATRRGTPDRSMSTSAKPQNCNGKKQVRGRARLSTTTFWPTNGMPPDCCYTEPHLTFTTPLAWYSHIDDRVWQEGRSGGGGGLLYDGSSWHEAEGAWLHLVSVMTRFLDNSRQRPMGPSFCLCLLSRTFFNNRLKSSWWFTWCVMSAMQAMCETHLRRPAIRFQTARTQQREGGMCFQNHPWAERRVAAGKLRAKALY